MPAILPNSKGDWKEDKKIVDAMHRVGTLLHISGHCHWANGLYHTAKGHIPSVVASVCNSHWLSSNKLHLGPSGARGDSEGDRRRGGYNIFFPPIVCDITVPGGPPAKEDIWITPHSNFPVPVSSFSNADQRNQIQTKPSLLFFGPPTDPAIVSRLLPLFTQYFVVDYYDDAGETVAAIKLRSTPYNACVAKLGSKENRGSDVMKALRENYGDATFIVVHSETAWKHKGTQESLIESVGVNLFVAHHNESELLKALANVASKLS